VRGRRKKSEVDAGNQQMSLAFVRKTLGSGSKAYKTRSVSDAFSHRQSKQVPAVTEGGQGRGASIRWSRSGDGGLRAADAQKQWPVVVVGKCRGGAGSGVEAATGSLAARGDS